MQALPYTYKNVAAVEGTVIVVTIPGKIGGKWYLAKRVNGWVLTDKITTNITARIMIPVDISWKLFSKSLSTDDVLHKVTITGDRTLAVHVLNMISVMA